MPVTDEREMGLPVTPYLLVGGRSSRMGRDKAFVSWRGTTLLGDAVRRLSVVGKARLLSGDAADTARAVQLQPFGLPVPDRVPHAGPLGGVVAALLDVPTPWALMVPVDQPCLPAEALLGWVRQVTGTQKVPAVTASWLVPPDGPEPLPLLLHRSLGPGIARAFEAGERRLLPTVTPLAGDGILPWPVAHPEWFRNLNSPGDLEEITQPPTG